MGGILVAGTSSDAGKSLVTAGLCRVFARRGVDVAPFKAQNMSNNSMVVGDGEIGRAQYLQALAAGVEPCTAMNPVLIKPGTDRRAHVVLRGRPDGVLEAGQYATGRAHLAEAAFAAFRELQAAHEVVVCEGAGSPAEINLRRGDYVNMGLARQFGLPVVLVGDIDRGGVLASIYGTWALLEPADRALLQGYLINKFRGDPEVLAPGLTEISARTGLRSFGVLNWLDGVWLDSEDALAIGGWQQSSPHETSPHPTRPLVVAVVRLPRVSNATDVDALAAEPGVTVVVSADPQECLDADLLVLPGTRATTADLAWLRGRGIDAVVRRRHREQRPVLGICGGYQMLGHTIVDEVEGEDGGPVAGLGLLPVRTDFGAEKVLARPTGSWQGHATGGYEIHHGVVTRLADGLRGGLPAGQPSAATPLGEGTHTGTYTHTAPQTFPHAGPDARPEAFLDGWRVGSTWGTLWHGTLEHDDFRRAWLERVAQRAGHPWRPDPQAAGYGERREQMIETLADALAEQVDVDALLQLATAPTRPTPNRPDNHPQET